MSRGYVQLCRVDVRGDIILGKKTCEMMGAYAGDCVEVWENSEAKKSFIIKNCKADKGNRKYGKLVGFIRVCKNGAIRIPKKFIFFKMGSLVEVYCKDGHGHINEMRER